MIASYVLKSAVVFSPVRFLAKRDRRGIQYGDPFPGMEHQYIEANGIRQVPAEGIQTKCTPAF